jgi:dolichol-phosphate mannosyltransferase
LSVIVPTYNERENIKTLLSRLSRVLEGAGTKTEVIIVDDDSPDRTWDAAQGFRMPGLRVLRRVGSRGLSSAILEGLREARGDFVCVMDADLSHPPEAIPDMLARARDADIVVASRYVPGGDVAGWTLSRRLISWVAGLMARPLVNLRDPMSGFFVVRGSLIRGLRFRPRGFKILLDFVVRSGTRRVVEVPYTFRDRKLGNSKLGSGAIVGYAFQLAALYIYRVIG